MDKHCSMICNTAHNHTLCYMIELGNSARTDAEAFPGRWEDLNLHNDISTVSMSYLLTTNVGTWYKEQILKCLTFKMYKIIKTVLWPWMGVSLKAKHESINVPVISFNSMIMSMLTVTMEILSLISAVQPLKSGEDHQNWYETLKCKTLWRASFKAGKFSCPWPPRTVISIFDTDTETVSWTFILT